MLIRQGQGKEPVVSGESSHLGDAIELTRTKSAPSRGRTLVDQVVERIRLEIARGTLDPGLQLVETRLAEDLHVSRGTVREALAQLAATGLVDSAPGAGVRVRYFSDRDVVEVGEVFAVLEGRAATHMTLPLDSDAEVRLRETAERMRGLRMPDHIDRIMALDREFHDTLLRLQPQSKLREAWRTQEPMLAVMVVALIRRGTDIDVDQADRHLRLVDAAMTGRQEALVAAIDEHYRQPHAH